jgi:hypothetical protein
VSGVSEELLTLPRMQAASWVLLLVLTGLSAIFMPLAFAWSVLVGGLLAIVSFRLAGADVVRLLATVSAQPTPEARQTLARQGQKGYLLKFWLRLLFMGVVLLVLIKGRLVDIFGLLVGLSTVALAVILVTLAEVGRCIFRGRR